MQGDLLITTPWQSTGKQCIKHEKSTPVGGETSINGFWKPCLEPLPGQVQATIYQTWRENANIETTCSWDIQWIAIRNKSEKKPEGIERHQHNLIRDMSEYDIAHDREMLEIKEWTKSQMNICSLNEVHNKLMV